MGSALDAPGPLSAGPELVTAETRAPKDPNPFTARARVVEALLDLQAAVPLESAFITIRRQPGGPDRPVFAYGAQNVGAAASRHGGLDTTQGLSLTFTLDDRVVGAMHLRVAAELDGDALLALDHARDVLEEEAVAFVRAGDVGLTGRELDVLRAMALGDTNREIATLLHLSHNTVKTHVERILVKLGAANRIQAVLAAAEAGLV